MARIQGGITIATGPQDEQTLTVDIDSLSHDGRGVAQQSDGKVVFVDGALPGEKVRVRVRGKRRSYLNADLIDLLRTSADRVDPPCQYFGTCGGCALQHLDHEAQLAAKHQQLVDAMQRVGKVAPAEWLAPVKGPAWGYRRKARLSVRFVPKKGGVLVGFRERHKSYVTPLQECAALAPQAARLLSSLPSLIADLSCFTRIPQIEVAVGDQQTCLVFRHLVPLSDTDLESLTRYAQRNQVQILLQAKGPDSIVPCWPEDYRELHYAIPKHHIEISFGPTDFIQVNGELNRVLIDRALDLLAPNGQERILDLFCGLGNFTLPLARYSSHVFGVEGDPALVKQAQANAARNQLDNVTIIQADLYTGGDELKLPEQILNPRPDKLLLDPPRSGAIEVVKKIPDLDPKRIVYISCNPATLARDSELLVHKHRYRLTKTGIVDMFPNTAHVESIAVFERSTPS